MHKQQILLILIFLLLTGCNGNAPVTAPVSVPDNLISGTDSEHGGFIPWGFYDFEIARDGSSAVVVPMRSADLLWGYHMNVVKLLEFDPCTNCLSIGNVHLLPNGDVAVDISIMHPYKDRRYTGFDVRGIIMFPASYYYPDNNLLELLGMPPVYWKLRIANHEYGDAELMNPDGWTVAWASEEGPGSWPHSWYQFEMPTEYPIFRYYPGKFASGENLSTLSAYRRFHSTETRHMFEVGEKVTRTYIIRPPESGPIKASYAIYAHWYPAVNVPVIDPAVDFPPKANSLLPYEFHVTQDAPLDPDAPHEVNSERMHWHIKTWSIGYEHWGISPVAFYASGGGGSPPVPHPSGEPDDYYVFADYIMFYPIIPPGVPGTWPMLCLLGVRNPESEFPHYNAAQDVYIAQFEYGAWDGEW